MKRHIYTAVAAAILSACSCHTANITVANDSAYKCEGEMVEIPIGQILAKTKSNHFKIVDAQGYNIPHQITADSLLIFQAQVPAKSKAKYQAIRSSESVSYDTIVYGKKYPERADDIAYENEYIGCRIYGPATQRKGERAFGYDIFLKHFNNHPIVPELYAAQCSGENWRKVDSLRRIDPKLADAFQQSFTYHVDHGKGMDCYAVGSTLGAGVAAFMTDDSTIDFPWCYSQARIIDNGPLRFTVELDFAPRVSGTDTITEHRRISLDAGSNFNRTEVWYDGLSTPRTIATGFPRRDGAEVFFTDNTIAFSDPTQGPDNGRVLLGIIAPDGFDKTMEAAGHVLGTKAFAPDDKLRYYWGFAWNREQYGSSNLWSEHIGRTHAQMREPLKISVR